MVRFFIAFVALAIVVSCYGKSIKFVDHSIEIGGEDKVAVKTPAEKILDPFDSIPLKADSPSSKISESNETPVLPPLHRAKFEEPKITENSEDPFELTV
uniref:Uncharacterized protein n=1 Tax=Panagrolaimus sp. ES5 TaxID=591445 RepID=A0AC34GRG8_9BILA